MRKKSLLMVGVIFCLLSGKSSAADLTRSQSDIIALIKSGQIEKAKEDIDKLITDNNQSPYLPIALYEIARNCEWNDRFDEAKDIFQRIAQRYPQSRETDNARLGVCRMNIYSLIIYEQMDEAKTEVNKMIEDFKGNSNLPDTLYWIGRRYGWAENYNEAKNIFQGIMQNYPYDSYANKAKLDYAKAEVMSYIIAKDYNEAGLAYRKLVVDFNNHPDLTAAIYWLGRGYEWWDRYDEANSIYEQLMRDYPNSSYADKARLDYARANILSLIAVKKYDDANTAIDRLACDFNSSPDLSEAILTLAERYHLNGLDPNCKPEISSELYLTSESLLERYVQGKITGKSQEARTYYLTSINSYGLRNWEKAAEFAHKLIATDERFEYAANTQWMIGDCYERMEKAGRISSQDADILIEESYRNLMDKYPDNSLSNYCAIRLGEINMQKQNNVKACAYFCLFLMNAKDDYKNRVAWVEKMVTGLSSSESGCQCSQCGSSTSLPQGGIKK